MFTCRSCHTQFVADVAKGTRGGQKVTDLQQNLDDLKEELNRLVEMKESDLDRIQNEAETARDEIQTYREWLKREIDGLAETTIDKLQAKHTECSDAINEEISQLKTAIAQNEEKKKKLDDAKDDTEAFLLLKQVQQGKCNDKTLIRDMKESPDRTTTFTKDMAIEDFIIYQTSLGEVIGNYVCL